MENTKHTAGRLEVEFSGEDKRSHAIPIMFQDMRGEEGRHPLLASLWYGKGHSCTYDQAKADALELERRWNAFEPGGEVDNLRAGLVGIRNDIEYAIDWLALPEKTFKASSTNHVTVARNALRSCTTRPLLVGK